MADETEKIEELNAHETDKTELEETGDSRFEDDKIASSGGEQLLPLSQSIESENQAVNDYKRPDDDVQNDDTMNSNALSENHLPLSHPEESGDETGTKSEDKTKTEADTKDEDELKTESSKTSEDELKTAADTQSENEYITMTDIRSEKLKTDDSLVNPDDINEPPLSISSESSGSNNNIVTGTTDSNSVDFSQTVQNEALDELTKQDSESITKGDSMEIQVTENPEDIKPLQQSNVVETSASDGQDTNEQEIKPAKEGDKKRKENQKKQLNDTVNGLKIKDTKEREVNPKTTKPSRAKPRSGKMVFCKVHLLDGQWYETEVTKNATGKELFDKVCAYLTLQEKEYFGLQYCNNNIKFWLNNEKKILKQVKGGTYNFDFSVKFYPPEPLTLLEDISRFQLCLQVRFDIFNGKLPCSFTTLAILGSYMVQAEVGDYDNVDEKEYGPEDTYMDKVEYAPDRSPDMRSKVYELHKTHKGLLPEESELQYLENAKKLAMYGVDLHQARDSMGVKLMLGVCASGVQVYKDKLRINRFVWPAILKLSYKRNNFYVKKRPLEGEKDGETIGFKLENHKMAKRLWKTCVEHHAFFRLHESDPPRSSNFPGFNSKFRYSGRTQKQVRDDIEKVENHPKFDRSNFKYSSMPQTNHDGYTHGYPDEKDRTDQKTGVTTPSTESGPPPYYQDPDGYNKMESSADKPNSLGDEDRRDRMPGQGDATETLGDGDAAGDAATLEIRGKGKKTKEDKEREKREKEEEKRRKKEEEKERKRLEKEKKLGRGDSAEDRTDNLGGGDATLGYGDGHEPGSAGLDSGKITAPLASDAADARKELGKPPLAETDIDGTYNNSAMGPEGSYSVAPLQSERSGRNKPGVSQETDIDGDYDKYKRDQDGQIIPSGDDKMGGKDDVDDDKKKGDKSKRKESDKSKDKKSGFFGRLRSPRDKDVKKGKGKETDIDSPPTSPVSPDYQKKMTVDEKVIEESNVVKKTEKMDVVDGTSQLASQEIKTEARENVDSVKEVVKDVKNDTSPIITVSTDAEQKIVENNSKNVAVEVHSESAQKASEQNVNGKIDIKVPPVLVSSEKNIEEVNQFSDTVEITKIANDKPEEIVITKSTEEEIKIEKEVSEIQKNELPVTEQTVDTNIKQNKAIIPDENIEDEVFSAEQKTEIKFKACNHVGSETGSFSSDSSDDESVCGSYHVESPLVQKSGKVKVESIVEEEQSESKKETVVLADMDKQENVSTIETLGEKQIVIESTMDKISEAVTNATNVLETKDTNIINSVESKETQSTQVESSEKSSSAESTETQITRVESSEKTVSSVVEPVEKVVSNILETTEANVVNDVKSTEESIIDEMKLTETNVENDVKSAEKNVIDEVKSAETIVCNDVKSTETNLSNVVKATETNVSNIVDSAESVTGEVKQEKDSKQSEEANHERNVDQKRDFDIVVSEKKLVSPDGKQIISVRSEKRTETIEKEVLTHTRRELKPEEFAKYEKEIKAADEQLKLQEAAGTKEIESVVQITSVPEEILVTNKSEEKPISEKVEETKDTKIDTKDTKIETTETKIETVDTKAETKDSNESTEQDIVEVKLVKSDNTLEENVKKMKYIDESSGDGSEKVKDHGEAPEVVTTIVNEEAGKDVEKGAVKLGKKESMRLQKEEKERKKKELNEEKERKKKELLEEKERIKKEKQEEKERVKKQKQEEKERKKKEKEAEKERKKMEKENHKSKNKKEDDVQAEIEEVQKVGEENVENEKKNENDEQPDKSNEQVEERVPTAIAMVMAKQKEEEKMEEIDLNDEPVIEEVVKEEPKVEKKRKKSKKDKKEKKEKEVKTPKHKKKTTTCFSFSTVPSSDEEEEPVEEVKEEIIQEEVKPVEEEVKVIPKQKGKGLGWALPGMDELQLKGTKHEEDKKQQSPTSSSPKPSPLTEDNEPRAPLAELTEIQDQSQFDESSETDGKKLTQTTDVEVVKESISTEVVEKQDSESKVSSELPVTVSEDKITVSDSTELAKEPEIVEKIEEPIQVETAEKIEIVQTTGETESVETKDDIATVETVEDTTPVETKEDTSKVETKDETAVVETKENTENDAKEVTKISEVGHGGDGEMIGRVLPEGEGSIDRRMQFIPVTPPVQETKDSLKHTGDSKMPFFDPASEDTLGKKVPPPVPPKGMRNGYSEDDRLLQDMPPTIPTESFTYENNTDDTPISTKNVPYVKTKTQTVTYEKDGYPYETEDGILISSQSHSTRTQTIETTTYKTEKDGKVETRVEKKVVITDEGDEDENDHDDLLAEAIRSVTEMNPDLSVTRIECMRQIEEVEK